VKRIVNAKALIVLFCIFTLVMAGICFGSGGENEFGDPGNLPPGSGILEPTPVILNALLVMLAAAISVVLT
jgi:hypothetical protein